MISEYPWFSSITTTTCAGVGAWESAVWARMAKQKDGTATMPKRETLRIGGTIGTPGEIWLKSEILAELVQILQGATALESSPGSSRTEFWPAFGIKSVRSSPS